MQVLPKPLWSWLGQVASKGAATPVATFNCGIGMAVVAAPEDVDKVISSLTEQGETCFAIGHITERNIDAVTFSDLKTN